MQDGGGATRQTIEDRERHWDDVWAARPPEEVGWFQRTPATSIALLRRQGLGPERSLVDIGGGASTLVDHALAEGARDVTVLDISAPSLQLAGTRLGVHAAKVRWVHDDVLAWQPTRTFDLWHDRAVFHFLVDPDERAAYRAVLEHALAPGGRIVVGTFAADGPTSCSGLPVCRYTAEELTTALGPAFELLTAAREEHITPAGALQPYTFVVLARRDDTDRERAGA